MQFTDPDQVIQYARRGRKIHLDDFRRLAPRVEAQIEIVEKIFSRGASIIANDVIVDPEHSHIFVAGMRARKRQATGAAASEPWNKASDADRENALTVWNMHNLTPEQMTELSGYSYSTLRRWFSEKHPRPDNRGRKIT